jgi:hypothetical protein
MPINGQMICEWFVGKDFVRYLDFVGGVINE